MLYLALGLTALALPSGGARASLASSGVAFNVIYVQPKMSATDRAAVRSGIVTLPMPGRGRPCARPTGHSDLTHAGARPAVRPPGRVTMKIKYFACLSVRCLSVRCLNVRCLNVRVCV